MKAKGEVRGGNTDGDGGEGEETRRAWLILHQTCPFSLQCVPHPQPPLAIFRQKL